MNRRFGSWSPAVPGEGGYAGFTHWSPLVTAPGSALYPLYLKWVSKSGGSWRNKRNCWNRLVLLKPHGEPGARFMVGFVAFFGDDYFCQLNTKHQRLVSDGMFLMLHSPMPCCYFVLSSAGQPVTITLEEVIESDSPPRQWQHLDIY